MRDHARARCLRGVRKEFIETTFPVDRDAGLLAGRGASSRRAATGFAFGAGPPMGRQSVASKRHGTPAIAGERA